MTPSAIRPRLMWIPVVAFVLAWMAGAVVHAVPPADTGWVIYSNEIGWLRIGTQAEFDAPWQKNQEIWGGNSSEPLKKELLRGGFGTREDALRALCSELTRVRVTRHALATPGYTTSALYKGKEYNLRLYRGSAGEDVIWRGQEYDLQTEMQLLKEFGGITPRMVFGAQYLCHVNKRATTEGPVEMNDWMCQPNEPENGGFWISDEMGFTQQHFSCDIYEGPFRDSFSLAEVMKRHNVNSVVLWPSGVGTRLDATIIPDNPRDFGMKADPVQPHEMSPEMLDWVIYATQPGWLRIGTRTEFNTPRPCSQEIWAGLSEDPIPKTIIAEGYHTYAQALRELCAKLSQVKWQYVPNNEPQFIILGTYDGKEYKLQLARDPGTLVASGRGYNYGAEMNVLRKYGGITPRLSFGEQYLVHSVGMGTMSGPVKTDRWMLVSSKPMNNGITVPDGMGGTFGHSIDSQAGPFKDNFGLAQAMKEHGIKSIGLSGGGAWVDSSWVSDNPRDQGQSAPRTQPKVTKVEPPTGRQGQNTYVTIFGTGIEYGAEISFGDDIEVSKLTYNGCDPAQGSKDEQWLVTLEIADDAETGPRSVTVRNYDGGQGIGSDVFEIEGVEVEVSPFIKLVAPHSTDKPGDASDCARLKGEQEQAIEEIKNLAKQRSGLPAGPERTAKMRELWRKMQDKRIEMEVSEDFYWEPMARIIGDLSEEEIKTLADSMRLRSFTLLEETQKRLDKWRDTAFSPFEDSPYADREHEYNDTRSALEHTLELWRSFCAMLLERREFEIQMARRGRALRVDVDLKGAQQRLHNVHVMQGEASLIMEQMMGELGLQLQDSFGAALRDARRKVENVQISNKKATAASQYAIITGKYIVGVCSTMFAGAVDTLQTWWNDSWLGNVWQLETLTADIEKRIVKSRESHAKKWNAMQKLRAMSSDQVIAMGQAVRSGGAVACDEEYVALDDDRIWVEDTDGGLLRLAACYNDTYPQLMESEYQIAIRRGELSLRDMNQTLNVKMGADPGTGEFNRWKRLLDPMGIIRTAFAEWIHGEFSSRVDFLGDRQAELDMMRQMLPRLRNIEFDIGRLVFYPTNQAMHYALRCKNPEYMRWWMKMRILQSKMTEDKIEVALLDAWDPDQVHKLKRMRALNRLMPVYPMKHEWARWLQLEGANRLMMWDWAGAIACYEQAAKTDPQVQSLAGVQALRDALDWQKTIELGIETFEFVGNQGMFSALFGVVGRWGGEALHGAGINLGMAAMDDLAIASAESSGFFGRFGTVKYWAGFADFAWGQINPFWHLVTFDAEWKAVQRGITLTAGEIAEEIVGPELSRKLLVGWFGMDQEYADFLAEVLVESAGGAVEVNRSLALQDATRLRNNTTKWQRFQVSIDLMRERSQGRPDMVRAVRTLEALYEAERARDQMELDIARQAATSWDFNQLKAKTQELHKAEQQARTQVEPATMHQVETVSQDVMDRLGQTQDVKERRDLLIEFWRQLPFEAVRDIFKGNVQHLLCKRSDSFRRELLDIVRSRFIEAYPQYREWFVGYTIYGSAAHPEWAGYKRLWSDMDITALLKADTPKEVRESFKRDIDSFFLSETGMPPEALDIHFFADAMPVFRAKMLWSCVVSEGTALANALKDNPALAQSVYDESSENLRLLWRNMVDPERYLLPGNLVMFNYLVKSVGIMQSSDLVVVDGHCQLREDSSGFDKVYGNLRFESWQGLDIVLDHMIHIAHAREHNANDMFAYSKDLAKYSIRVLLGRIIQTPEGLERMNNTTASEVADAGGLEAYIVKVGKELAQRHGPQILGMQPSQMILLDEWIMRKEARKFGEIFEVRAGRRLGEKDFRLNQMVAQHINETEAFLTGSIKFTVATQASYLRQLMTLVESSVEDPVVRNALMAKFRQIVCSQAALWQRLQPGERRLVQSQAPPGSPYWRVIELCETLGKKSTDAQGNVDTSSIEVWWPTSFLDDDREPELPPLPNVPTPFEEPVRAGG